MHVSLGKILVFSGYTHLTDICERYESGGFEYAESVQRSLDVAPPTNESIPEFVKRVRDKIKGRLYRPANSTFVEGSYTN